MIEDQEQFAEVVRATMGTEPGFEAIGHATDLADGLDLIETLEPDLVAVNVHLGPIADMVSQEWGFNEDGAGQKTVWASFAIRGPREF